MRVASRSRNLLLKRFATLLLVVLMGSIVTFCGGGGSGQDYGGYGEDQGLK